MRYMRISSAAVVLLGLTSAAAAQTPQAPSKSLPPTGVLSATRVSGSVQPPKPAAGPTTIIYFRYQAVCYGWHGRSPLTTWWGPVRVTREEAQQDANAHMELYPRHFAGVSVR